MAFCGSVRSMLLTDRTRSPLCSPNDSSTEPGLMVIFSPTTWLSRISGIAAEVCVTISGCAKIFSAAERSMSISVSLTRCMREAISGGTSLLPPVR
jgi:hypothetical protein